MKQTIFKPMKNLVKYLIIALLGTFISCNPYEDIYDSIESEQLGQDTTALINAKLGKIAPPIVYTLTDDDYQLSSNENVRSYSNFSASAPPNTENLGSILNNKFLAKEGQFVEVTYQYYYPLRVRDTVSYTVQESEYQGDYPNWSSESQIFNFLSIKYPDTERGFVVSLTYDYYSGSVNTLTNKFIRIDNTNWQSIYVLDGSEYNSMEQRFANFGSHDDARFYIPIFLKNARPYTKASTSLIIEYNLYENREVRSYIREFVYDGMMWVFIEDVVNRTSTFTYDSNIQSWKEKPVFQFLPTEDSPTRDEYTLTQADYEFGIGNDRYGNYDDFRTDEEIINDIANILNFRFDNIEEGDIFPVTYKQYNGSSVDDKTIILKAAL